MRPRLVIAATSLALTVLQPPPEVRAQPVSQGWQVGGEGGAASDYLFRGVDQTRGRAQVYSTIEADGPSAHFGAFASNVAAPGPSGARNAAEVDLYGGWLTAVQGFDLDLGAIAYVFAGSRARPDLLEPYARLGRTLGPARFEAAVHYGALGEAGAHDGYAELSASYPLTDKLSLRAAAGHLYEDRPSVLDAFAAARPPRTLNASVWSLGATYSLTDHLGLDLRWSDLDHAGPDTPSRLVASVRARFP